VNKLLSAMESMRLSVKLTIGFGFILLVTLFMGLYNLYSLNIVNDSVERIYEKDLLALSHIKEANINLIYIGRSLRQMALAQDLAGKEKAKKRIEKARTQLQIEFEEGRKRLYIEKNIKLTREFDTLYAEYLQNVDSAISMIETRKNSADNRAEVFLLSDYFNTTVEKADDKLNQIALAKEKASKEAALRVTLLHEQSENVSIALLLCALVGGGLLAWLNVIAIRRPSENLRNAIEQLAVGNLDITIPHTGYHNEIGAMARSITVLQKGAKAIEMQRWIKHELMEIDHALQTVASFEEFGAKLSAKLAKTLNLAYTALYIADTSHSELTRVGGYGCDDSIHPKRFDFGQGLVGQCAKDQRAIFLSFPEELLSVTVSMGKIILSNLAILPIVEQGKTLAVLELGALESQDERSQMFIESLLSIIATKIQIIAGNMSVKELFEQMQIGDNACRIQV
jgi:two-component system, sensor histidine kinase and response regulator